MRRADFYQLPKRLTTPLILAVVAVLLRDDSVILLSQPPADKREATSWKLPGVK